MFDQSHTIVRLAAYARVSTEEQKEGQTIDSQLTELERFSREKGWPIAGVYKDDGWSGGVMERPELDRLRDDAQKGLFEAVLVNDVDRLARDVAHLGVIKRDLERHGVQVIFRKLPSDGSPTYNLMVNILGSFAEFEREMIADRTRRGRRHKVETRKQYLGSNTAFGYRYTPKDKVGGKEGFLEIVPDEADVVRQMFQWVDEDGLSARRVQKRLAERNIPAKKGAAQWASSSVLRVLNNEMYAGTWYYNKYQGCEPKQPSAPGTYRKQIKSSLRRRPHNEWVPLPLPESLHIISLDRWKAVQAQLARNRAFSPRNERHQYLLKGLIRCGACRARYVGDPSGGYFFYRCMVRCKRMRSITEESLNKVVKAAVSALLLNPDVILEPLRELENSAGEKRDHANILQTLDREAERLVQEESRMLDAYRIGLISPSQLGEQLEKVKTRRTNNNLQRSEIEQRNKMPFSEAKLVVTDYCAEAAKNLAKFSQAEWREFLRTVLNEIEFHGDRVNIKGRITLPQGGLSGIPFQFTEPVPKAK